VGSPATENKIFYGVVTRISYDSAPNDETLTIEGMDYTKRLRDATVNNVYTNKPAGSIVKSVLYDAGVSGLTTNNVSDGPNIVYINFKHRPVLDAIREISELAGFDWWVDSGADLHFVSEQSVSAGVSLSAGSSGNITRARTAISDDNLFNSIYVYGGRRLIGTAGSIIIDGVSGPTYDGGSVLTLYYKPHDTEIKVNGVIKVGGVYEMTSTPTSGVQYLVDYDQRRIIFTSGTACGYNVPGSPSTVTYAYDWQAPVIKLAEDQGSIDAYGKRVKVIVNEEIKDPRMATKIALAELSDNKNPRTIYDLDLHGIHFLQPGHTVTAYMPLVGLSGTQRVLRANYNINANTLQSDDYLSVQIGEKI